MAINASIPKLLSTKVLMDLKSDLIANKICTLDLGAQVTKVGDTVTIPGFAEVTAAPYTGASFDDAAQQLSDTDMTFVVDKDNFFVFDINDIEAFRSTIDLKGMAMDTATYNLKKLADSDILGLYTDAGTTIAESVSVNTIINQLAYWARRMDELNIPAGSRFLIIPPWMKQKMSVANIKFSILEGVNGMKSDISWAQHNDMDVYVTNNLTQTGSEGSWVTECMCGTYNAIAFAQQVEKTIYIPQLHNKFAGRCVGRHIYGRKVIRPKELIRLTLTQSAAATSTEGI